MRTEEALVEETWAAVAGDAARPDVTVSGARDILPATLPTGAAATAAVVTALAAAAALTNGRAAFATDRGHISDAVRSERVVRTDGQSTGATFAPLSRFWRTADGFMRTHANYPWHRDALLRALDLSIEARVDAVASEIGQRVAIDIEERVFAEGGIAARVREEREWQQHPQGAAVCAEPLVGHAIVGPAGSRMRSHVGMPADGIRVLDLTRVIAGPVCTRFLGALGADVLRIDPPDHHDIPPGMFADTLLGKRSAVLDLTRYTDRLHALLDHADVLVCGYRPGALDRFGLTDEDLAERHPGALPTARPRHRLPGRRGRPGRPAPPGRRGWHGRASPLAGAHRRLAAGRAPGTPRLCRRRSRQQARPGRCASAR
ncbi:CoA transferase [uncultured Jatrophihabitans sp.]|uniref:CoA transferase n=1 Tax=uncultured Jatrophihabitans sp. TaxID=1610747 RepID=UPI0035CA6A14